MDVPCRAGQPPHPIDVPCRAGQPPHPAASGGPSTLLTLTTALQPNPEHPQNRRQLQEHQGNFVTDRPGTSSRSGMGLGPPSVRDGPRTSAQLGMGLGPPLDRNYRRPPTPSDAPPTPLRLQCLLCLPHLSCMQAHIKQNMFLQHFELASTTAHCPVHMPKHPKRGGWPI